MTRFLLSTAALALVATPMIAEAKTPAKAPPAKQKVVKATRTVTHATRKTH